MTNQKRKPKIHYTNSDTIENKTSLAQANRILNNHSSRKPSPKRKDLKRIIDRK
ncbi:MAG: hypothetical protein WBX01_11190 [Nitrososphaeraceae archaeon]